MIRNLVVLDFEVSLEFQIPNRLFRTLPRLRLHILQSLDHISGSSRSSRIKIREQGGLERRSETRWVIQVTHSIRGPSVRAPSGTGNASFDSQEQQRNPLCVWPKTWGCWLRTCRILTKFFASDYSLILGGSYCLPLSQASSEAQAGLLLEAAPVQKVRHWH